MTTSSVDNQHGGLFAQLAERNREKHDGGAEAEAVPQQGAEDTVRTVLRVKRKRCDEAAPVFVMEASSAKRPNLASMMESGLSLSKSDAPVKSRRVFRRVASEQSQASLAKACVKAHSIKQSLAENQEKRHATAEDRKKQARVAKLKSSRYMQCGEEIDSGEVRVIDIEENPGTTRQKRRFDEDAGVHDRGLGGMAEELLCNGSVMSRFRFK